MCNHKWRIHRFTMKTRMYLIICDLCQEEVLSSEDLKKRDNERFFIGNYEVQNARGN